MITLREILLDKVTEARTIIETLRQRGEAVQLPLEWEKGYLTALEDILALEGISLRRSPRITTMIATEVVRLLPGQGATSGNGTITDLSVEGCNLVTMVEIAVGEVLALSFTLPEQTTPLKVEGWVRRAEKIDGTVSAGVELKELPGVVMEALQTFLIASAEQAAT